MLLLDNDGYIIGFNTETENKSVPFAINGAKWNGEEWEYPSVADELLEERDADLPLEEDIYIDAFELQMLIGNSIHPHCGSFVKEKEKEITVLIPSYKKSAWVKDSIQSVLSQTMQAYKIIALAMTDEDYNAASEIASPLLQVVKSEQMNASTARNYLVTLCPTEYFIFLDADDTLEDNFIRTVYEQEESIVFTDNDTSHREQSGHERYRYEACFDNLTGLLCKEAWNEAGGLKEELCKGGEDCYFLNELFRQKKWKISFCPKTWYNYGTSDAESLSNKKDDFVHSKEIELYLHKDWYKKCLEESYFENCKTLLDALEYFCKAYENKESSDLISTKLHVYYPDNVIQNECNKYWNENKYLFEESRTRETDCVCLDENQPNLYGRKFDLYIYSRPAFDWKDAGTLEGCTQSCYYINNSKIDINLPLATLLKKYCVIFDGELSFTNERDYIGEEEDYLFENQLYNFCKSLENQSVKTKREIVTLVFIMKCNKQCPYCSQSGSDFSKDLNEETLLENFYEMVDKIEEVYGKNWIPQICGGEPTLLSESFAKKIMERLSDYRVTLVTNGNAYKEHIFYSYPNLDAYVHLTEKPYNDSFLREYDCGNIVVTKEDLNDVLEAVKNHTIRQDCNFPIYAGTDSRYVMTKEDIELLDKTLEENGYYFGKRLRPNARLCGVYKRQYKEARIWNKTFVPCCGKNEEEIPMTDWHGQAPGGKHCDGCAMYLWY